MAGFAEKIKLGWRETRGNIAVELAKWIGGSSVVGAIFKGVSQAVHRVSIDWLLLCCLVVFGMALILFSLYRDGKGRVHKVFTDPSKAKIPSQTSLLSPLQTEALQLARDMRAFLAEIGPEPQSRPQPQGYDVGKWLLQDGKDKLEWTNSLTGGFKVRFAHRLPLAVNRLEEANYWMRSRIEEYANGVGSIDHIEICIRELTEAVFHLELKGK